MITSKKAKKKTISELLNLQTTIINNQTTTPTNTKRKVSELLNYPTKTTEDSTANNSSPKKFKNSIALKNSIINILEPEYNHYYYKNIIIINKIIYFYRIINNKESTDEVPTTIQLQKTFKNSIAKNSIINILEPEYNH